MSEQSPASQPEPNPLPHVIYGKGADQSVAINPQELSLTMQELGTSEQAIKDSAIYVDPKSRFQTFGTHYPNLIGRLRFRSVPAIQEAKGDIVRLSTTMKGKARTAEEMNRTLVHELEHLAQGDRHDRKVTAGHIAIWGLATAGAIVGNQLGKNKVSKTAGTAVGATLGHSIGYIIAPHERQARQRARQVKSIAVSRN